MRTWAPQQHTVCRHFTVVLTVYALNFLSLVFFCHITSVIVHSLITESCSFSQASHPCESYCPKAERYVGTLIRCILAPLYTQFVAKGAQVGRMEIPARNGFPKAPPWYHQLTRCVCNNIGDILVKVRGSGVKVRFWTPFWHGNYEMQRLYHT